MGRAGRDLHVVADRGVRVDIHIVGNFCGGTNVSVRADAYLLGGSWRSKIIDDLGKSLANILDDNVWQTGWRHIRM